MTIIDPIRTRVDLTTLNLGFSAFPDVQPFSPRAAVGYQDLLEELYRYVTRDIYTFLQANAGQATWDNNVDALLAAIDGVLAQQKSDIDTETNAALQQVIDATLAITDPVTLGIVNNTSSNTRKQLDALYLKRVSSAPNAVTGWWHVDDFGAVGDGVTPDQAAVQAAIDAANAAYLAKGIQQRVYFSPKVYSIAPTVTVNPVYGLMLKSGVELYGQGTLRVAPGSYWIGTDYALLRSPSTSVLVNAGIRELSFDGNKAAFNVPGDTTQCNNITLRSCSNVWVVDVRSFNANGGGLMIAGSSTSLSKDVRVEACNIHDNGNIGIQCAQFDGLRIINNTVSWCASNGIDVYGEPQSHTGGSTGINFQINGNRIHDCANGIFLETVAQGTAEHNRIRNCSHGLHVNRINAEPNNILIAGNQTYGGDAGVGCTGDTGGVTIRDNEFELFNRAGVLLGGAGNVSQYYIVNNTMNGNSGTIPCVVVDNGTNQANSLIIRANITKNRDRTYDFVNYCSNSSAITRAPFVSPGDTITV